jgi:DNA polymerase III delta prime subunit
MKFFETHFEEYINSVIKQNLHPKLEKIYSKFPDSINKLGNVIFYGPSGVGKYSQMLYSIKKYSPSELKYEKKLSITYDKKQYFFKISDIHYEIDMSLLGCNSKLLWHEIYQQIIDIVSAKNDKNGIIVCKDFHNIHNELLENFYSYMQDNNSSSINIKFIFLSEEVSFIPDSILNCSEIINIARPSKNTYIKCINKKLPNELNVKDIINIKYLHVNMNETMNPYEIMCNKIIKEMLEINELKFLKFRDLLYDIFIYNLDITDCIWYILTNLIKKNKIKGHQFSKVLLKTYVFLKYYNNNYRPIYHLESYLYYLINIIHEL